MKISEAKFHQIVRYFATDLTATDCAGFYGISLRSVNSIYCAYALAWSRTAKLSGLLLVNFEADESHFGPRRMRGHSASRKTIVFGLLKRSDCIYTEIVSDASKLTCRPSSEERSVSLASSTPMAGERL